MSTAATEITELGPSVLRQRGGGGKIKPEEKPGPGYKAIGILYAKQEAPDSIELKVLYEAHIPDPVKVAIAERFGVGAREWNVT